MSPGSPHASTWNAPPPLRFHGSPGQHWSASAPYSLSPSLSSFDDAMVGKRSLYDELLPHISELSSDDELAVEFLQTNCKRRRSNSSSGLASPRPTQKVQKIEDTESVVAREIAALTVSLAAQVLDTSEKMEYSS